MAQRGLEESEAGAEPQDVDEACFFELAEEEEEEMAVTAMASAEEASNDRPDVVEFEDEDQLGGRFDAPHAFRHRSQQPMLGETEARSSTSPRHPQVQASEVGSWAAREAADAPGAAAIGEAHFRASPAHFTNQVGSSSLPPLHTRSAWDAASGAASASASSAVVRAALGSDGVRHGEADASAGHALAPGWSIPQTAEQSKSSSEEMPPYLDTMAGDVPSGEAPIDVHADRRVFCAAATFGSAAGTLILGPTAGVALGAAALYAAAREDGSGALARRAGAAYLRATDAAIDGCVQAMDQGVKKLGQVAERSCQQLSTEVDIASMPAPVRAGVAAVLRNSGKARTTKGSWEEARRIRERHPDKVPIICERSPYATGLPDLAASKFLVPGGMACGEFKYMIHKQLRARSGESAEQTIYMFVDGLAPKTSTPMADLYAKFCAEDGFLYITYSAENTLGW